MHNIHTEFEAFNVQVKVNVERSARILYGITVKDGRGKHLLSLSSNSWPLAIAQLTQAMTKQGLINSG